MFGRAWPQHIRPNTISCCRSAAFSVSRPPLRSERRDQDTRNEPEEPDHPISLRDSPSASVERDFLHTAVRMTAPRSFRATLQTWWHNLRHGSANEIALSWAVRSSCATALPLLIMPLFGFEQASRLLAIGAMNTSMVDVGGTYRNRLIAMGRQPPAPRRKRPSGPNKRWEMSRSVRQKRQRANKCPS